MMSFGLAGRLLQVLGEHLSRDHLDDGAHLGIVQLGFGLGLELRIGYLDADHRGQALAHIVAGQVAVLLFEQVGLTGIVVEGAGEGTAEAGDVHTAIDGVDAVGERELGGGPAIVVLYRQFDLHIVDLANGADRTRLDTPTILVQVAHKGDQATLKVEGCLAVGAFIAQGRWSCHD